MKKFVLRYKFRIIATLAGALGGYLYYSYIGCDGSCFIASNPMVSVPYFALLGYLCSGIIN